MIDSDVLAKIKALVVGKVEHAVKEADDGWQHHELLPLYMQFALLERLESIDDTLITLSNQLSTIDDTLEGIRSNL